jgi:carboxylesterase type B
MPFRTGRLVDQSEVIARVNDLYNPQLDGRFHGDVEAAFVESDGDVSVVCPMKELAKMMHAAGTVVWHYAFEFGPTELDMSVQVKLRSPITPLRGSEHWASHSSELPYVFHNPCAICVDLTCRMDQVCTPRSPHTPETPTGVTLHRKSRAENDATE